MEKQPTRVFTPDSEKPNFKESDLILASNHDKLKKADQKVQGEVSKQIRQTYHQAQLEFCETMWSVLDSQIKDGGAIRKSALKRAFEQSKRVIKKKYLKAKGLK